MKSTRFSRPLGHLGTALTFGTPFGILACWAACALHQPVFGLDALGYALLQRMILGALMAAFAVEERHVFRTALLYPFRDLLGFLCWAASYAGSTILWRGRRYRLSRGGLMHSLDSVPGRNTESPITT